MIFLYAYISIELYKISLFYENIRKKFLTGILAKMSQNIFGILFRFLFSEKKTYFGNGQGAPPPLVYGQVCNL